MGRLGTSQDKVLVLSHSSAMPSRADTQKRQRKQGLKSTSRLVSEGMFFVLQDVNSNVTTSTSPLIQHPEKQQ